MEGPGKSAEELKEEGNKAYLAKRFDEALRCYSAAIALSPTTSVLFSNRCAVYLAQNRPEEALADARESVRLDRHNAKGFLRLGKALYALGRYDDAIREGFDPAGLAQPDAKTRTEIEELRKKAAAAAPNRTEYEGRTFSYARGQRHAWPDQKEEEFKIRHGM